MIKEFKPALFFLLRFLGVYFLGNILYGVYIESFDERPDTMTYITAAQTSVLINLSGQKTSIRENTQGPTVFLDTPDRVVLNVFEGCNGVNVMIVFVAFMVAFGGPVKKIVWFIPAGILTIHLFNLGRMVLLFFTALYYRQIFYYVHKYFFTAILYAIVFGLWAIWVLKIVQKSKKPENAPV